MSQQLISLNQDLKRLRDEGYHIEVYGGHLIVRHIPYVNSNREVKFGTLVSTLCLSGNKTMKPDTHVMMFDGDQPCDKNGVAIQAIIHSNLNIRVKDDVVVLRQFSNKPKSGYDDYFHKVNTYATILASHAKSIDEKVSEKPHLPISEKVENSNFRYYDTNSSRANISELNAKFDGQKIAIVGLGGTGSYILDLVAKTNVQEIHIYDGDLFLNHNAFRAPGAASIEKLEERQSKVEYLTEIYSAMHLGIHAHNYYVDPENIEELKDMNYVFVCVDNNQVRNEIINFLLANEISFADVGMGVQLVNDSVIGIVRVTSNSDGKGEHLNKRIPKSAMDIDNEYVSNIQIAELNALNAVFAVIRWKKTMGFYQDFEREQHLTYSINVSQLLNEDHAA